MNAKSRGKAKKGDELFNEIKERMLSRLSGVDERLQIVREPRTRQQPRISEQRFMSAKEFFGD